METSNISLRRRACARAHGRPPAGAHQIRRVARERLGNGTAGKTRQQGRRPSVLLGTRDQRSPNSRSATVKRASSGLPQVQHRAFPARCSRFSFSRCFCRSSRSQRPLTGLDQVQGSVFGSAWRRVSRGPGEPGRLSIPEQRITYLLCKLLFENKLHKLHKLLAVYASAVVLARQQRRRVQKK